MKKLLIILILAFLSNYSFGQSQERDHSKLSSEERHDVAHDMIKKGGYYGALEHLKELVEKHPENSKYLFRLGQAYLSSRDYLNAEGYFLSTIEKNKKVLPALYFLGISQQYQGKYNEALENFRKFNNSKYRDKRGEERLKLKSKIHAESCEYALMHNSDKHKAEIEHLGDEINSAYTEFAPWSYKDSILIFSSLQSDSVLTVKYGEVHYNHVKIYSSQIENGSYTEPIELEGINRKFESTANGSFSHDGSRFFFTRCNQNRDHKMICKIYESNFNGSEFSKPKKLNSYINPKGTSNTMPYMGYMTKRNRKIEVLYFVSDRKRGRGGLDIWFSMPKKDGTFGTPRNAGKKINTPGNEVSPYYDSESETLYFSSDLRLGYGGFDVFHSKGGLGKFSNADNIGKPVNSSYDDTYYFLGNDKFSGYISSNRSGGKHLLSENCCDDIYQFTFEKPAILNVVVYDSSDYEKVSEDATYTVYEGAYKAITDTSFSVNSLASMDTLEASHESRLLDMLGIDNPMDSFYTIQGDKEYRVIVKTDTTQNPIDVTLKLKTVATGELVAEDSLVVLEKDTLLHIYTLKLPYSNKIFEEAVDTVAETSSLKEAFKALTEEPVIDSNIVDSNNEISSTDSAIVEKPKKNQNV